MTQYSIIYFTVGVVIGQMLTALLAPAIQDAWDRMKLRSTQKRVALEWVEHCESEVQEEREELAWHKDRLAKAAPEKVEMVASWVRTSERVLKDKIAVRDAAIQDAVTRFPSLKKKLKTK